MAPKKVMKAMKKTTDLDERSKAKVSKFFQRRNLGKKMQPCSKA